jgi:hypothetical protein
VLDPGAAVSEGFTYAGIGIPTQAPAEQDAGVAV